MTGAKKRKRSGQTVDSNCKVPLEDEICIDDVQSLEDVDRGGDQNVIQLSSDEDCLQDITLSRPGKRMKAEITQEKHIKNLKVRDESTIDERHRDSVSDQFNKGDSCKSATKNDSYKRNKSEKKSAKNIKLHKIRRSVSAITSDEDDDFVDHPQNLSYKSLNGRKCFSTTKKKSLDHQRLSHDKSKRKLSLSQTSQTHLLSVRKDKGSVMWACVLCTFLNHPDMPFCEMCDGPRSKEKQEMSIQGTDCQNSGQKCQLPDHTTHFETNRNSSEVTREVTCLGSKRNSSQKLHCYDLSKKTVQTCSEETKIQNVSLKSQEKSSQGINQTSSQELFQSSSGDLGRNSSQETCCQSSSHETQKTSSHFTSYQTFNQGKTTSNTSSQNTHYGNVLQQVACTQHERLNDEPGIENTILESFAQVVSCTPGEGCDGSDSLFSDVNDDIEDDISCYSSASTEISQVEEDKLEDTICDYDDSNKSDGGQVEESTDVSNNTCMVNKSDEGKDKTDDVDDDFDGLFDDDWEGQVLSQYDSEDIQASEPRPETTRVVNLDLVTIHSNLVYCCSQYTGRVYLFDMEGKSLGANFQPLDVEVGNHDDLPDVLLHPENLKLVKRFVREWNSLSETKRRLIMKSGQQFISPLRVYEDLRSGKTHCFQRHRTKEDTASVAISKAQDVGGSTRVIKKPGVKDQKQVKGEGDANGTVTSNLHTGGVVQAMDKDGVPLCLHCYKPYRNNLLDKDTIVSTDNAWTTRFCSHTCMDSYWMKTNAQYGRDRVYEVEHGRCQMCGFEAHAFFKQIRDTSDIKQRAMLLNSSKLCVLTAKQREQIVKHPAAGQFWHADHIRPVWEGGGECDIDNLRTLCVLCHQKVTAEQAKKRAHIRKLGKESGDISMFFKPISS